MIENKLGVKEILQVMIIQEVTYVLFWPPRLSYNLYNRELLLMTHTLTSMVRHRNTSNIRLRLLVVIHSFIFDNEVKSVPIYETSIHYESLFIITLLPLIRR